MQLTLPELRLLAKVFQRSSYLLSLYWLALLVASSNVVGLCSYDSYSSPQEFPGPYNNEDWFKYLESGAARAPSKWLELALSKQGFASQAELLQKIYSRRFVLENNVLLRSHSHRGDVTSLHNALFKLVSGSPVSVVALGGELLSGTGVYKPRRKTDGAIGQFFSVDKCNISPSKA
eukprot:jgi/Botrbrau1/15763/Bobra.4_1s0127.1